MTKIDDKRQAILDATLLLLAEHGFHGTAMSKVARQAKVSTGIIYHYFANKDELVVELYKEIKQKAVKDHIEAIDQSQPLRVQIFQLWEAMIRYYLEHQEETAFLSQFTTSPYHTKELEEEMQCYYEPIIDYFDKGRKEMIIKELPISVMATFVLDVPSSLARKQATGQLELTEELVVQVVDSLWQAIRL